MPNIAYLDLKYDRRSTVTTLYDDPFTITALTNNCTINISNISDDTDITFKYSIDNGMTYEDVTIEADDTFSFTISTAGYSVPIVKTESGHWMSNIRIDSDEGDEFSISGNIMTLVDASQNITAVPDYYFFCLFENAEDLVDASELRLPATEVGASSYANMFAGCSNLKKGPAILPATTLDEYCYGYMFGGCSSLIAAPSLPATTLAERCYNAMFLGCSSLTIAPELPATTLAYSCYVGMFGYSGLSSAPVLPATTLAENCYEEMFIGCWSLVTAPALPATTLAKYCYKSMFDGCTSLTTAPNLIAENMIIGCYKRMFYNCENLNFIRILAKDTATDYITDWVHNVAPVGIFIKDPDTNYTIDSDSGVPIGWTIANEGEDIPNYYSVVLSMYDPELHTTLIGTGRYLAGSTVTISALDINDYTFDGWISDDKVVSYSQTWSFEIHENVSLKAVFKQISSYRNEYFTIKSIEDNNYISIEFDMQPYDYSKPKIDIKVNDDEWYTCTLNTSPGSWWTIYINGRHVILNEGDKIQFRRYIPAHNYDDPVERLRFSSRKKCNVSGNIACLDARHDNLNYLTDTVYVGKDLDIMYENEHYSSLFEKYNNGYQLDVYNAEALILPATTLTESCYRAMFYGCTSLVKAPALPATTLAKSCYYAMFNECYSLIKTPVLPATTLVEECYYGMFSQCLLLNNVICLATDISATNCISAWLGYVSNTGTFTKNASMNDWPSGGSGIPSGWTVQDYVE